MPLLLSEMGEPYVHYLMFIDWMFSSHHNIIQKIHLLERNLLLLQRGKGWVTVLS